MCVCVYVPVCAGYRCRCRCRYTHRHACNTQVNALVCTWASSTNNGPFWPIFWFFNFV